MNHPFNASFLALIPVLAGLMACSPAGEPDVPGAGAPNDPAAEALATAEATATQRPAGGEAKPAAPPPEPTYRMRNLLAMNIRGAQLERLFEGLDQPWAMEFMDERSLLITERGGRLLRFELDSGALTAFDGVPAVANEHDQTGLLDVELHPDFADNRKIYFSYTVSPEATDAYFQTVVSSAVLADDRLEDVQRVLTADPPGWSPSNFGGALEFDDAGFLYVSIGDRSEEWVAQRGDRLQGKILRLHDDGTVPADNPFVDDPAVDDRVYALGVRNAQGLHFDAGHGLLFETEHGPMGGDEVNVIERAGNYGWPEATYGMKYTGASVGSGTHAQGMRQPLFYFTPSIAVSPLTVYRGSQFPEWEGDLIIGTLKSRSLARLDFDNGQIRSIHAFLGGLDERIRDVRVGAEGALYVLTEPGRLYRLSREIPPVVPQPNPSGEGLYALVCAGCHDTGAGGAPMLDDRERWTEIARQPRADIERHTLEGLRDMPERGLCDLCTDEQLLSVVDYMLETAGVGRPRSEGE